MEKSKKKANSRLLNWRVRERERVVNGPEKLINLNIKKKYIKFNINENKFDAKKKTWLTFMRDFKKK